MGALTDKSSRAGMATSRRQVNGCQRPLSICIWQRSSGRGSRLWVKTTMMLSGQYLGVLDHIMKVMDYDIFQIIVIDRIMQPITFRSSDSIVRAQEGTLNV